jgi:hypothetical protein
MLKSFGIDPGWRNTAKGNGDAADARRAMARFQREARREKAQFSLTKWISRLGKCPDNSASAYGDGTGLRRKTIIVPVIIGFVAVKQVG